MSASAWTGAPGCEIPEIVVSRRPRLLFVAAPFAIAAFMISQDKASKAARDEADQYWEKGCPGVRFGAVNPAPRARVAGHPLSQSLGLDRYDTR